VPISPVLDFEPGCLGTKCRIPKFSGGTCWLQLSH
jgi:hypothetical protein